MITLLGAAPNTGNQGVSALCYSAVAGITSRGIAKITVADHGRGLRSDHWKIGSSEMDVDLIGISHTRRLWRGDCLRTIGTMSRLGGMGNQAANAIINSDAVLDVSGGDSFTDLYGEKRFQAMTKTKRLALDTNRPLVLLPQTLGPFKDPNKKAEATDILRRARAVWVRDQKSFDFLQAELGDHFDPNRHHLGIDMAVLLPQTIPHKAPPAQITEWLDDKNTPVAGLNVSGLLCQNAMQAQADFGLKSPHTEQVLAAAQAILDSDPQIKLLLVPHVNRATGDPESDYDAAIDLQGRLETHYAGRVATLPQDYNATELKWVIARLDWFAGARMHATIAGFSSGVATLGLGYSDKAKGVFDQCGLQGHVADLRQLDAAALADVVGASLKMRAKTKAQLAESLGALKARANAQMDKIVETISLARSEAN